MRIRLSVLVQTMNQIERGLCQITNSDFALGLRKSALDTDDGCMSQIGWLHFFLRSANYRRFNRLEWSVIRASVGTYKTIDLPFGRSCDARVRSFD